MPSCSLLLTSLLELLSMIRTARAAVAGVAGLYFLPHWMFVCRAGTRQGQLAAHEESCRL